MVAAYFAYGSNMNPARVLDRGLEIADAQSAVLPAMRLVFDKTSRVHAGVGHANIVFDPSATVEGVLYHLVSADQIERMDPFESAPVNYSRDVVIVETRGGNIACWTYFANAAVRKPGLKPPRSYLEHLLAGREFLSESYYRVLSEIECEEGR